MARKNQAVSEEFEPETSDMPGETFQKPPDLDGFQDIAASRSDGWYQPEPGSWFLGRLIGRFEMNQRNEDGKKRAYYQVRVKESAAYMMVGKGEDAVRTKVEAGHLLAFDERKAMEVLRPQANSDGVYDVMVHAVGKEKVEGTNRTFWKFEVKAKTLRAPKTPLQSRDAVDDDIPF